MINEIAIGAQFETYYGNGQRNGTVTVTKVTAASIFVSDEVNPHHNHREGKNSVSRYLTKGLWKPLTK